jgi:predicted Zn-dependent protease
MALTTKAAIDGAQGDFARSLLSAQRATTQCPGNSMAWILAARAYAQREDEFNARRMFQQGIEANPQDSVLAGSFVKWLQEQGRNREAVTVVRRLTRNAPALLSGWRLFRDTCRQAGDSCAGAAEEGLAAARTRHGIDPPPGERLSSGLFGRFELK